MRAGQHVTVLTSPPGAGKTAFIAALIDAWATVVPHGWKMLVASAGGNVARALTRKAGVLQALVLRHACATARLSTRGETKGGARAYADAPVSPQEPNAFLGDPETHAEFMNFKNFATNFCPLALSVIRYT